MKENKINLFLVHIICNYCNKHTLLRLILEKKKVFMRQYLHLVEDVEYVINQ